MIFLSSLTREPISFGILSGQMSHMCVLSNRLTYSSILHFVGETLLHMDTMSDSLVCILLILYNKDSCVSCVFQVGSLMLSIVSSDHLTSDLDRT